ncbi:MAG TPA: hypothetical protein V6D25_26005 [Leptolyngbyaceae cyanobacterium]
MPMRGLRNVRSHIFIVIPVLSACTQICWCDRNSYTLLVLPYLS